MKPQRRDMKERRKSRVPPGLLQNKKRRWVITPESLYSNHPEHNGKPVKVGPYEVLAGGTRDLVPHDFEKADILIPLLDYWSAKLAFGKHYEILAAPMVDMGGVPDNWEQFLKGEVIPLIESGRKVMSFCMGSHGRTGCFLGSLISILESEEETPDPIAAVRNRHCEKSVETKEQAEAIFALRGQQLPHKYVREFAAKKHHSIKYSHVTYEGDQILV